MSYVLAIVMGSALSFSAHAISVGACRAALTAVAAPARYFAKRRSAHNRAELRLDELIPRGHVDKEGKRILRRHAKEEALRARAAELGLEFRVLGWRKRLYDDQGRKHDIPWGTALLIDPDSCLVKEFYPREIEPEAAALPEAAE